MKPEDILNQSLNRRDMLKKIAVCSAAGIIGAPLFSNLYASSGNGKKKPNIIFILGDNHNAHDIRCVGHPFIKTPGLDRLVSEGVRFENTFNTTSLCSPSRASILTGAYAHNHGVLNNHTPWKGQMKTFLQYLSENGYDTAFIGKWHMPGKGLPNLDFLDLFVSYTYREGQGSYFNCPLIVNGNEVASKKGYISDEMNDYALDFIKKNRARSDKEKKPFCIYLSHRPAHPPFKVPENFRGIYDDQDVSRILTKNVDPYWYGKTKGNVFQGVMMGSYYNQYRKYLETITAMDNNIAVLLDKLDEMGLRDDTIVIYMADNGVQWGTHDCHGIREAYEDSAKLPLIIRAPGLMSGRGEMREQMALNIDIAPTILDMAGLPIPVDMDGQSLVPLLKNPGRKGRDAFLMEFWRYYPENTPSYKGVRTDRYKYIEFERGRKPWLFDIKNDPREIDNLYGTEKGDMVLPELKKRLGQLSGS